MVDSLRKVDTEKAIKQYKKLITEVSSIGDSHKELVYRYELGNIYRKINAYDSAENQLLKSIVIAQKEGYHLELADAYNNLGATYYNRGDIPLALQNFRSASEVYIQINDDMSYALSLVNIGIIYKKYSVYDKATQYLYDAIEILENKNLSFELASAYNTLGNIRAELGDTINTLPFYYKSLDIRKNIQHKKGIAGSLNNIGLYYKKNGLLDSAKVYFEQALDIKSEIGDQAYMASTLTNIADVYIQNNQKSKANDILNKSLEYSLQASNYQEVFDIYNKLASINISEGNISKAEFYQQKGEETSKSIDNLELIKENLKLKIDILKSRKDFKNALIIKSQLIEIKDKILNKEKNKALTEMQIKYEVEKQKQTNQLLHEETIRQQAQLETEQFKNILYGVLSFALLILSSILFFFFRQRNKHNKLLKALLNEQQHRIKNFLQTIGGIFRMHARKAEHEEVKLAVKEGSDRLEAMTLIHNQLYRPSIDAPATVNFTEFTQKLVTNISSAYAGNNQIISPELELDNIDLDVNKAVALGLILNEVVNNSFKYAIPNNDNPQIVIKLKLDNENLLLSIQDNGPGLPKNQKGYRKGSLGMNLIKLFAKNLHAEYEFVSQQGLTFSIKCKY